MCILQRTRQLAEHRAGFTLIELSIVLVIVGLLIGGVIIGRDLIHAAEIRGQLSQLDQYRSVVNTFKSKYDALPGDMHMNQAARLGFFAFSGSMAGKEGYGDGNSIVMAGAESNCAGECGAFWRHLVEAGMLPGNYGLNSAHPLISDTDTFNAGLPNGDQSYSLYMPAAKLQGSYVSVGALVDGVGGGLWNASPNSSSRNVFSIVAPGSDYYFNPTISAVDMYSIDRKIDDGMPNRGRVLSSSWDAWDLGFRYWTGTPNASSVACTHGGSYPSGADVRYNSDPATGGDTLTCIPIFFW